MKEDSLHNAWLLTYCLTLYITPTYLDTTQLFAMLFPSQFFICNHTKVLVCKSNFCQYDYRWHLLQRILYLQANYERSG